MANSDENSTVEPIAAPQESAGGETLSVRNSDAEVSVGHAATDEVSGGQGRNPRLLLGYSCFFFVLLTCQYAWLYFDRPQPVVWNRGEEFRSFRVDVNHATWVDWIQLPGIGQATAEDILEDLQRRGPFESIDDLLRVPGIGPKTLKEIRPWLTIRHDETEQKRRQSLGIKSIDGRVQP